MKVVAIPRKKEKRAYLHEPAHCAREALCEFLEGYRVVRRGLVPGHYLRSPVAVTWPLKRAPNVRANHLG